MRTEKYIIGTLGPAFKVTGAVVPPENTVHICMHGTIADETRADVRSCPAHPCEHIQFRNEGKALLHLVQSSATGLPRDMLPTFLHQWFITVNLNSTPYIFFFSFDLAHPTCSGYHPVLEIAMSLPTTMKAVILKESYRVAVEDVPVPRIKEDGDVLVKVHLAGLCGE